MKRKNVLLYTGLILFGIFFFFFVGEKGALMGGDSELYINFGHYSGVMPVYPLFLQLCRVIFGDNIYLEAAAAIQGLLALACSLIFVRFLQKRFDIGILSCILLFLLSLMPYAIEIPGHVISHELMTEGLAYPLFYIFILLLMIGIFDRKMKYVFAGFGQALILALIRPQMQFLFAVAAVVFGYVGICRLWGQKGAGRRAAVSVFYIFAAAALVVTGLKMTYVIDGWYENTFFGGHGQDSSNYTVQCRVLYASDKEDGNLFEDPVMRRIYEETYEEMEASGCTYHTMRNDLWRWKDIVGCSGYISRIVQGKVELYLRNEREMTEDIEVEQTKNYICGEMTDVLLRDNWARYLAHSLMLMPSGFVASVLFQREGLYTLCHIATLLLYVLALGAVAFFYINPKLDSKKAELMLLISGTAIVNVVASNLILFGLQRYMVYTYGLFYMGMYLLLLELWKKKKEVFGKK